MIQIENIPVWLREHGHFVLRRGKMPYTLSGEARFPKTPADWGTAEEALAAWRKAPGRYDGIGVVIASPLVGIDLDHVISEEGELSPVAQEVLDMVDTYAEKSPSGTGLHLLGLAPDLTVDKQKHLTGKWHGDVKVEVYFENRYFTFTGECFAGSEVREISDGVQEVLDTYLRRHTMSTGGEEDYPSEQEADTRTEDEVAMDAAAAIDRMKRGKDWPTIEAQLTGEDFSGLR